MPKRSPKSPTLSPFKLATPVIIASDHGITPPPSTPTYTRNEIKKLDNEAKLLHISALENLQKALLGSIESQIRDNEAPLSSIVSAFNAVSKALRLELNQSTENIAHQFQRVTLPRPHARLRKPKE